MGMSADQSGTYRGVDQAGTYKETKSTAMETVPADVVDADLRHVEEHGYVIIENLIPAETCDAIKEEALRLLSHTGRNSFEGLKTQRLYATLQKTRMFDRLVDHPRILALLDHMFEPNYLLSQCQVINILPGEDAQALHTDDIFAALPRPRPELGAATVWAIDPFTSENGSTAIIPGSHKWPTERGPAPSDTVEAAEMPQGSVVFYPGTFWHGGGANRSGAARMGITCQYCQPYMRPQENYSLSISRDVVKSVSEDIRRMLGYSIHPPFMGMVDGMHPKRLLED